MAATSLNCQLRRADGLRCGTYAKPRTCVSASVRNPWGVQTFGSKAPVLGLDKGHCPSACRTILNRAQTFQWPFPWKGLAEKAPRTRSSKAASGPARPGLCRTGAGWQEAVDARSRAGARPGGRVRGRLLVAAGRQQSAHRLDLRRPKGPLKPDNGSVASRTVRRFLRRVPKTVQRPEDHVSMMRSGRRAR